MRSSLRIGTIFGINIEVHFSWLIIFVLFTVSLATGWFPVAVSGMSTFQYWVAAIITVLLFFGSVLAHELAHSLVARLRGLPVSSITLFIFGGVSNLEREPSSAGVEFQMAFVGPLTSLLLGALALVLFILVGRNAPLVTAVLGYLGFGNIAIGVFNLIPGFPLDGGRVLRSIMWRVTGSLQKATRWAANIGQIVAYLMIFAGIWIFFAVNLLDGLWIGFIGLFLLQAATAESAHVALAYATAGVTVADIMRPAPAPASPNALVHDVVDEYVLREGQRAIPIVLEGRMLGLVTLRDIRQVPRSKWAQVTVGQIMVPLARLTTVAPSQPVDEALTLLSQAGVNQLPVLSEGQLVGVFSVESVMAWLSVRRELGVAAQAGRAAPSHQRPAA